jgi:hypothetical protein
MIRAARRAPVEGRGRERKVRKRLGEGRELQLGQSFYRGRGEGKEGASASSINRPLMASVTLLMERGSGGRGRGRDGSFGRGEVKACRGG